MRGRSLQVLILAAPLCSCSIGPTQEQLETVAPPIEVMLARIDRGIGLASPEKVGHYVSALDRLEKTCSEPRIRIAGMAATAVVELKRRYDQEGSILTLLEKAAAGLEGAGLTGVRCQEALAAVVVQIGEESRVPIPDDEGRGP